MATPSDVDKPITLRSGNQLSGDESRKYVEDGWGPPCDKPMAIVLHFKPAQGPKSIPPPLRSEAVILATLQETEVGKAASEAILLEDLGVALFFSGGLRFRSGLSDQEAHDLFDEVSGWQSWLGIPCEFDCVALPEKTLKEEMKSGTYKVLKQARSVSAGRSRKTHDDTDTEVDKAKTRGAHSVGSEWRAVGQYGAPKKKTKTRNTPRQISAPLLMGSATLNSGRAGLGDQDDTEEGYTTAGSSLSTRSRRRGGDKVGKLKKFSGDQESDDVLFVHWKARVRLARKTCSDAALARAIADSLSGNAFAVMAGVPDDHPHYVDEVLAALESIYGSGSDFDRQLREIQNLSQSKYESVQDFAAKLTSAASALKTTLPAMDPSKVKERLEQVDLVTKNRMFQGLRPKIHAALWPLSRGDGFKTFQDVVTEARTAETDLRHGEEQAFLEKTRQMAIQSKKPKFFPKKVQSKAAVTAPHGFHDQEPEVDCDSAIEEAEDTETEEGEEQVFAYSSLAKGVLEGAGHPKKKFPNKGTTKKPNYPSKKKEGAAPNVLSDIYCWNCGGKGHTAAQCPSPPNILRGQQQKGHLTPGQQEYAAQKSKSAAQAAESQKKKAAAQAVQASQSEDEEE